MSNIPDDLRYSEEHEYLRNADEDGVVVIGITDYAQGELGDVVYVDLPDVGAEFDRMEVFGTIEAVKAVSELFIPVSGKIVEINAGLDGDPSLVNQDPYNEGWMVKLRLRDPAELQQMLSSAEYAQHVGE